MGHGEALRGCADQRCLWVANSDAHVHVVVTVVVIDGATMKPCVVGRSEDFDDRVELVWVGTGALSISISSSDRKEVRRNHACPFCEPREHRVVLFAAMDEMRWLRGKVFD